MKKLLVVVLVMLMTGMAITVQAQDTQTPQEICSAAVPADEPTTREFTEAEDVLDLSADYRAVICTDAGAIYIDLFEGLTPVTVNSFVFLSENGYYNNTIFHRVIADFMAQGGDPTGTGTGGPGYQFTDEFVGFLNFDKSGWLAMANAGPNTNGSQFFITTAETPHLNYQHTIFGEVLEGQDIVESIQLRDPQQADAPATALETVVIITDPESVNSTYEAPEAVEVTADDVLAALEEFNNEIPPQLSLNEDITGTFSASEIVQNAPESVRSDYETFLSTYTHQFRVANEVENAGCDLTNFPFMSLRYTLDAFESRATASEALGDGFLDTLAAETGFSAAEEQSDLLPSTLYTNTVDVCETEALQALTYWQRGRYVITAQATLPAEIPPDIMLGVVVGVNLYEQALSDILRAEVR